MAVDKEQATLKKRLEVLLKQPHNLSCADCPSRLPRWASTNLGVFICTNCSGIHRGLGVHISKVRSCALDKWTPELVSNMENIGNARANAYWERNVPPSVVRPREGDMKALDRWIRDKYELGHFKDRNCAPPDGKAPPTPAGTVAGATPLAAPPPPPPKPSANVHSRPAVSAPPLPSPTASRAAMPAAAPRPAVATIDLLGGLDAPAPAPTQPAPPAGAPGAPAWDAFAQVPPAAPPAASSTDWMASFATPSAPAPAAAPQAAPTMWDAFAAAPPPAPPAAPPVPAKNAIMDLFGPAVPPPPPHAPPGAEYGMAPPYGMYGAPHAGTYTPAATGSTLPYQGASHAGGYQSGAGYQGGYQGGYQAAGTAQLPGLLAGMHVSGGHQGAAAPQQSPAPAKPAVMPVMGAGAEFSL